MEKAYIHDVVLLKKQEKTMRRVAQLADILKNISKDIS